jgi:hypothetical protein
MIDDGDLLSLERSVRQALRSGDDSALRVLGYGEISLVLGWPSDNPGYACKRLPEFPDGAAFDRYAAVFARYLDLLGERGVTVVPSTLQRLPSESGRQVGYVVQVALPTEQMATDVLRSAVPDADHPVLRGVAEAVVATVDSRVGLDAQLSNWVVQQEKLGYFDLTTPMLASPDGRSEVDLDLFLAAAPWLLRAALGRLAVPGILQRYHEPRSVLLDLAANLHKERLPQWVPAAVTAANRVLPTGAAPLTVDEVERDYRSDARQWELLLRLRRADRWWQRTVRRRTYPFLLPGRIER